MSLIASSSTDVKFHQWANGSHQHTYLPPNYSSGYIKSISWGKDGSWIVIVPSSGYAEILGVKETAKQLLKIKDIHQPTYAIFPKTTKKFVALGTHSGQVLIYDIKSKSVKKRFPRASSWIQSIDCNAKDTHLASATSGGDILVYNITTANLTATYKVPNSSNVTTLSFHRTKRNLLAAGTEEGVVAVWDINNNEQKASFQAHYAPVTEVALSPMRSDLIATVGKDRQFIFYDVHNKKCVVQMEVPSSMLALDFSHCGLYLGMGSQNGHIVIYDMRNLAKPINGFPAHEGKKITKVAFQKCLNQVEEESTSSTLIEESVPLNVTAEEVKHSPCSNSPFTYCEQEVIPNMRVECKEHEQTRDIADSFMNALGNFDNTNVSTPEQENCQNRLSDARYSINLNMGQISTEKKSHLRDSSKKTPGNKQLSSTPKYLHDEMPATIESPIITQSASVANIADIKKAVSEIIQEEIGNLRLDIRHEFMESMAQMRRQFLDLQMFLVKEFVNVENTVYKVSGVTVEEYLGDTQVVQENNRLKQEIEQLKEKIVERDGPL